jgi:multiple sugar transport system ATP-binding protein
MDEPLSNLDAKLRVQTRSQIAALQRRLGVTTVYVTHDQVEAMTMGDRVAVLKDGLLQQVGTPIELYDHPTNVFVAGFIGSPAMNLVDGELREGGADIGGAFVPLQREVLTKPSEQGIPSVTVGFRPEDITVSSDATGIPVEVLLVEELGADAFVYGTVKIPGAEKQVVARTDGRNSPNKGQVVYIAVHEGQEHVFSPKTGERLSA